MLLLIAGSGCGELPGERRLFRATERISQLLVVEEQRLSVAEGVYYDAALSQLQGVPLTHLQVTSALPDTNCSLRLYVQDRRGRLTTLAGKLSPLDAAVGRIEFFADNLSETAVAVADVFAGFQRAQLLDQLRVQMFDPATATNYLDHGEVMLRLADVAPASVASVIVAPTALHDGAQLRIEARCGVGTVGDVAKATSGVSAYQGDEQTL